MLTSRIRAAAGLGLAVAALMTALPACNKKKENTGGGGDSGSGAPKGYTGSKGGPPGGPQPHVEPGMPAPPAHRPLLTYNSAAGMSSKNNLQQIGLAIHNFNDQHNGLPVGIADKSGKPGLSWRVAILPLIEQDNLYKQFKLDEPWNSDHNKKLIAMMPKIFSPPGASTNGYTYYRGSTSKNAMLELPAQPAQAGQLIRGISIARVPDGLSNTLLVGEASDPVIWTNPEELPFTPGNPPKFGGGVFADGFHALLGDGSVRWIKSGSLDTKTLSNFIQTNDNNPIIIP